MGVSIASFYHPLRLAEELAMLDVLSGGRLVWGAGRGFDPDEFRVFGVPAEESRRRFLEAVDIVRKAWTSPRLDHRGEFWRFEGIEVLPKPLQTPHPPIYLAAGSPGGVRAAARLGMDILLGPHSTFDELAEHREIYAATRSQAGHGPGRTTPVVRLLAIDKDDASAREVAKRGVQWLVDQYMNPSKAARPEHPGQHLLTRTRRDKMERYLDHSVVHGCPERVLDTLLRLEEDLGIESLIVAPLSETSLSLLLDRVVPSVLR
jgi:alkanesulfonate monooxygenase SsuD/methylene tetrahydromethanopterin reductase-like flavin-dependent oxidoreductase (luciferase family)